MKALIGNLNVIIAAFDVDEYFNKIIRNTDSSFDFTFYFLDLIHLIDIDIADNTTRQIEIVIIPSSYSSIFKWFKE